MIENTENKQSFYCNTFGRKCKWNKDNRCEKAVNRFRHCTALKDLRNMRF